MASRWTSRCSGASAQSLHVAGQGPIGDLAAETMAHCRLVWTGACRHWLPVRLPHLVSSANEWRPEGRQIAELPGDQARAASQAGTPTHCPAAGSSDGTVHLVTADRNSTYERQRHFRQGAAAWPTATDITEMHGSPTPGRHGGDRELHGQRLCAAVTHMPSDVI